MSGFGSLASATAKPQIQTSLNAMKNCLKRGIKACRRLPRGYVEYKYTLILRDGRQTYRN